MKYRIRRRPMGYVVQESRLGLFWRVACWDGAYPYLFRSRTGAGAAIAQLLIDEVRPA